MKVVPAGSQVPSERVSVAPLAATPLIEGLTELLTAELLTGAVASDTAVAES
ncbi:unannotated protein [freshwater metagenome]|uniref:Unannotated protein n=1 Tax=freshwater metagenome TaxID=449393 RepID=A0A6J6R674_9ZZZZ